MWRERSRDGWIDGLPPEAFAKAQERLGAMDQRQTERRRRASEVAWGVIVQTLGTVLGGVILLLIGVAIGALENVSAGTIVIAINMVLISALTLVAVIRILNPYTKQMKVYEQELDAWRARQEAAESNG